MYNIIYSMVLVQTVERNSCSSVQCSNDMLMDGQALSPSIMVQAHIPKALCLSKIPLDQ